MRVEIQSDNTLHTLRIDPCNGSVYVDDVAVKLSSKEYLLFQVLGACAGTMVTKEYIAMCLFGTLKPSAFINLRTLVCRVRKKFSQASGGRNYIVDVSRAGYMLA